MTIRLGLLHPHRALVEALEVLLSPQPDLEVVAAHTSLDWIQSAVATGEVDVLLVSVDDHTTNPAAIRDLREKAPELGVVAITDCHEATLLSEAVRAGVRGWVERDVSLEHLVTVVRGVYEGETWFPPAYTTRLLETLLSAHETRGQACGVLSSLSVREREVLDCLAAGLTRSQIAERLVLSPHTVRTHISNVLRKLDVHSTLAAVSIARQANLP